MSADGEIEVAVKAEGADDAAADVAEGSQAQAGGPGAAGEGGLAQSLRGGIIGGLIASAFGPVLEVLDPILEILEAFVMPVMAFFLRLFQPLIRLLLQALPVWVDLFERISDNIELVRAIFAAGIALLLAPLLTLVAVPAFILTLIAVVLSQFANVSGWLSTIDETVASKVDTAIDWLQDIGEFSSSLPGDIVTALTESVSWLTESLGGIATTIGAGVWAFMLDLPAMIGRELAQRVPDIFNPLGGDDSGGGGVVETAGEFVEGSTQINISGGLDQFIERVERESGVDIP